ncbi:MAG: O-antigen ligase family protein, partial [Chlamydiota bacterium]
KKFFSNHAYFVPLFSVLYPLLLFVVFTVLIAINGSRIALVAQAFVFLIFLVKQFSVRSIVILLMLLIPVATIGLQENKEKLATVTDRMQNLFRIENVEMIGDVWAKIDTELDPVGNDVVFYDDETQDQSWWMRIHKWTYALKIYVEHPISYLQGVGPGFATAALDGGIIRIFVEYGIIGFLMFGVLFWIIARQSFVLGMMTIVLLVNMIFFDAYLAYKPMSLLFLMIGFGYSKNVL